MNTRNLKSGFRRGFVSKQYCPDYKGKDVSTFPKTTTKVVPDRKKIERICRKLWKNTPVNKKTWWVKKGKPLISPDEVFGPDVESEIAKYSTRIGGFLDKFAQEKGKNARETTLVAIFLGPRWGHIVFDTQREEKIIREDIRYAIRTLKSARNDQLDNLEMKDSSKGTQVTFVINYKGEFPYSSAQKKRRKPRTSVMIGALCYFHLLEGKKRPSVAKLIFGNRSFTEKVEKCFCEFHCPISNFLISFRLSPPRLEPKFPS